MVLPDIFTYDNYRTFLADRRRALGLSVRAISEQADIRGTTWIGQVERGTRGLSDLNLGALAKVLRLSEVEVSFLRLLVQREQAREAQNRPLREELEGRIAAARGRRHLAGEGGAPALGPRTPLALLGGDAIDPARLRAYQEGQRRAAELLRALDGGARPPSKFLGVSHATDADGLAQVVSALGDLGDRLRFVAAPQGDEAPTHRLHLEVFPLTRTLPGRATGSAPRTLQVPTVYEHERAAAFVAAWVAGRGESLAWLAARLGVARSTLTRAIKHGVISQKLGDRVVRFLRRTGEFSVEDAAFFRLLLIRDMARDEARSALNSAIATLRVAEGRKPPRDDYTAAVLGDWRCAAVIDLPHCMNLTDDHGATGAALDPPISAAEAQTVVQKLVKAGMLWRGADGYYRSNPYPLWLKRRVQAGGLESAFLANATAMVAEGIRRTDALWGANAVPQGQSFRSLPLRVAEGGLGPLAEALVAGQNKVASLLGDHASRADRVLQANLHIFPVVVI